MTNKKFKVAAMSMALTACVAAQPLIANAADDVNTASNEPTDSMSQEESSTGSGDSGSTGTGSTGEAKDTTAKEIGRAHV